MMTLLVMNCVLPHVRPATASTPQPRPKSDAPEDSDQDDTRNRLANLRERTTGLLGGEGLLDGLHFGWFDRPYARATLAVVIRTLDEIDSLLSNTTSPDSVRGSQGEAVRGALAWCGTALDRVSRSTPDPVFRPHRTRIRVASLMSGETAPQIALLRAEAGTSPPTLRTLDLSAALGQRVFATQSLSADTPPISPTLVRRADALGMAVVVLGRADIGPNPACGLEKATRLSDGALDITPPTLDSLLSCDLSSTDTARAVPVASPSSGEPLASSIARIALARRVGGNRGVLAAPWRPPATSIRGVDRTQWLRAVLWLQAFEGQTLALVDLHAGYSREGPHAAPSGLTDPAMLEAIVHTGLDMQRIGTRFRAFEQPPSLELVVGSDAAYPDNPNRWAAWIEPLWQGLLERQIRFDVIPPTASESSATNNDAVRIAVRRRDAGRVDACLHRVELALALRREHASRLTARGMENELAAGTYVREGRPGRAPSFPEERVGDGSTIRKVSGNPRSPTLRYAKNGAPCVAVINLSSKRRNLRLRGGTKLGPMRDLLADEHIPVPETSIHMSPWQVRLLWPDG